MFRSLPTGKRRSTERCGILPKLPMRLQCSWRDTGKRSAPWRHNGARTIFGKPIAARPPHTPARSPGIPPPPGDLAVSIHDKVFLEAVEGFGATLADVAHGLILDRDAAVAGHVPLDASPA